MPHFTGVGGNFLIHFSVTKGALAHFMSGSPSVNLVKINLLGAIKMKHFLLNVIGAAALVFGLAGAASAITFDAIPRGATNDGLDDIYGAGTTSRNGWYGAQVFLIGGPADIEVSYLGSEAGFKNEFWWGGNLFATTPGIAGTGVWDPLGIVTDTFLNVASGALPFLFRSPFPGDAVNDGSNPDPTIGQPGPNYFVSFANENASGGQELILWFDDNGAGKDDNHDDMAIRLKIVNGGRFVTPIPVPAALPLLLTGLFGLGLLRSRRRRDEA